MFMFYLEHVFIKIKKAILLLKYLILLNLFRFDNY